MTIRNAVLTVFCLVLSPLAQAGEGWKSPADPSVAQTLDSPHSPAERLHERRLPRFVLDWRRSRELAVDMICDLGLIALAFRDWEFVDCENWALLEPAPASEAMPGLPIVKPGSSGPSMPDFEDIRRRTVEQRMHSI